MNNIVIVGNGGFAREVKWLIEECNKIKKEWNLIGWISTQEKGTIVDGLPIVGDDQWLIEYSEPISAVIAIGNGALRKRLVQSYRVNKNISFPNIVAPNVILNKRIKMGQGCIITFQSTFTVDIEIGNFIISNLACTVGHDCKIGNYTTLYPGAHVSGGVTLGECSSVGTGASIIQGCSIGENTFIGAGAVVVKNIPSNCTAVGVPAKVVERE